MQAKDLWHHGDLFKGKETLRDAPIIIVYDVQPPLKVGTGDLRPHEVGEVHLYNQQFLVIAQAVVGAVDGEGGLDARDRVGAMVFAWRAGQCRLPVDFSALKTNAGLAADGGKWTLKHGLIALAVDGCSSDE